MSLWSKCFVPFDFKKLRGNHPGHPMPTVFDNSVATADGTKVSSTPAAQFVSGVLLTLLVLGLVTIVSDIQNSRPIFVVSSDSTSP